MAGIREVLHGRFTDHAYPLHTHDTWTLFIVDDGAIRYDLDRYARGADTAFASILPPFVVHDGRPGARHGFYNRVLYLEPEVIGEDRMGRAVDRSVLPDPALRRAVSQLNDSLCCVDDALEAEAGLAFVADRVRTLLDGGDAEPVAASRDRRLAEALRAFLDAHAFEPLTLAAAAAELSASPARLARAFSVEYRITPHRYVVGRRLDAARDRILEGQPLADVAAEVGFFDQAHLTRRFKAFLGTPPGRFARANRRISESA